MSINSISPIDGRYSSKTASLADYFSEKALIKYRIFIEANYLIHLAGEKKVGIRKLNKSEVELLKNIHSINDKDAELVKQIETKGYKKIPATNHDVKAIEYFIKDKLENTSLKDIFEMIHFALTSEDINNTSYALMIKDGFNDVLFPEIIKIYDSLYKLAVEHKNTAMLARTHGQPASPTTFGKEMLVFVARLKEELANLSKISILAKLNGATGNYNAHFVTFPGIDWQKFSASFVDRIQKAGKSDKSKYYSFLPLQLDYNPVTTQIEPHDSFARIFDSLKRINIILIDFSQDMWRYISDGWIKQRAIKGEIGSSAMPHKVNPIDFENAEGNFGVANALLTFFSSKLSISRLQRDLSDSTVQRNIGVAFAHTLIAYHSLLKGLSKVEVNKDAIAAVVNNSPEVIAEAIQNILRVEGVEKPYELLKDLTRGKKVTLEDYYDLIKSLKINDSIKERLLKITPSNYIGIADKIVDSFDPEIY